MRKVLYTANLATHILAFHLPYLKWFKEQGFEVHVAFYGDEGIPHADKVWNIPFGRNPFSKSNIVALRKLWGLFKEHRFDVVHCHTPIAGLITRLTAVMYRSKGTNVLYTAHGFHFYKGAPLKNWLTYLPAEWILSLVTDGVITINREDFDYLHRYHFASGKHKINGIGLDPERLKVNGTDNRSKLRSEIGFSEDEFLVLYIAEFIDRKNHRFVIENIPYLIQENPELTFLFAGRGVLQDEMEALVRTLQVEDHVKFLGFREDIGRFLEIADMGISSSKHEGLGLGVAEMMFNQLPVVVSNDRGHRELVDHGSNGFIFEQDNSEQFRYYISKLYRDKSLREKVGKAAKESMDKFMVDKSLEQMTRIYNQYL
ncbi:glycosyltransferase family 4 protein [Fodinibius salsisoli]|uniref:Glycosyltransferase family 4 protein n=1 Tax=Fodinibius salsisoli TaxID=2820877 RepID=A0ABT3PLE8_9BACT|nr:glycosyltransferase family 4 protein [Fodinibius salsisoli]MCW9706773.1 glycosyltransferase family 4 protein [Fodinibius salsisoli]